MPGHLSVEQARNFNVVAAGDLVDAVVLLPPPRAPARGEDLAPAAAMRFSAQQRAAAASPPPLSLEAGALWLPLAALPQLAPPGVDVRPLADSLVECSLPKVVERMFLRLCGPAALGDASTPSPTRNTSLVEALPEQVRHLVLLHLALLVAAGEVAAVSARTAAEAVRAAAAPSRPKEVVVPERRSLPLPNMESDAPSAPPSSSKPAPPTFDFSNIRFDFSSLAVPVSLRVAQSSAPPPAQLPAQLPALPPVAAAVMAAVPDVAEGAFSIPALEPPPDADGGSSTPPLMYPVPPAWIGEVARVRLPAPPMSGADTAGGRASDGIGMADDVSLSTVLAVLGDYGFLLTSSDAADKVDESPKRPVPPSAPPAPSAASSAPHAAPHAPPHAVPLPRNAGAAWPGLGGSAEEAAPVEELPRGAAGVSSALNVLGGVLMRAVQAQARGRPGGAPPHAFAWRAGAGRNPHRGPGVLGGGVDPAFLADHPPPHRRAPVHVLHAAA